MGCLEAYSLKSQRSSQSHILILTIGTPQIFRGLIGGFIPLHKDKGFQTAIRIITNFPQNSPRQSLAFFLLTLVYPFLPTSRARGPFPSAQVFL